MLAYLQKFNNLPAELRQKVSDAAAMAKIERLEKKYKVSLAALIMKVMVKEIALNDLTDYLLKENLAKEPADQLAKELKENFFSLLGNYFSASVVKPSAPAAAAMAMPADQPKVKGASFFFSPDDEEEIRELAKKIGAVDHSIVPAALIDEKLKEIISRAQINFGSADLADRFSKILRTYLRGIRDRLETKATLMKPFLSGGLSFDEDSAAKVMSLADKVARPVKSRSAGIPPEAELFNGVYPVKSPLKRGAEQFNGVNLKADGFAADKTDEPIKAANLKPAALDKAGQAQKPEIVRDAPYDFSRLAKKDDSPAKGGQLIKVIQKSASGADIKPPTISQEPAKPSVEAASAEAMAKIISEIQEKNLASAKKAAPLTGPAAAAGNVGAMPLIKRRFEAENLSQSQKIRVEDVKYVPRVMGPLDEIKYMDLINFRRLDREPAKSAGKINNKISLLEEEGYGKKLEGIKYWRICPLYKLYLEIGNLSISENKPIDVIIEERKIAGLDYLTDEEFKAIMDLNKSLRF